MFTALKVASVLAMIGAIVGEYFGGSFSALGVQIQNAAALFQFETAWAAILVACLFGIGFYLAVALAERLVVRWYAIDRSASETGTNREKDRHTTKEERMNARGGSWGSRQPSSALAALAVARSARRRPRRAQADKVTLQLKWVTQAQFAGYYAAQAKGYYKAGRPRRHAEARRPGHHARSRSSRRGRRSSASTGCRACSRRATRAATSSTSPRCSHARA